MKPLRIALLGAGRIGQVHARTIVQRVIGAQLVAIADPMPAAAAQATGVLITSVAPPRRLIPSNRTTAEAIRINTALAREARTVALRRP